MSKKMNRAVWTHRISDHYLPRYPCPRCSRGYLVRNKDSVIKRQPKFVPLTVERPEDEYERFVMMLDCNNAGCGEVVAVVGDIVTVPETNKEDANLEYVEYYMPIAMWPPPQIFEINRRVPQAVSDEIELSFQMYWADYGVAASRLRTSIERLMDHFKVAKTRISRRDPTKPGKRVPLDLSARIDKFAGKINTQAYSEMLHALRVVGNLGTHGERVKRSKMLDAYQLYELALNQMFEDKKQTAKAIIKRLKAKK